MIICNRTVPILILGATLTLFGREQAAGANYAWAYIDHASAHSME